MRAPRGKRTAEDFGYLSEGELALLLRAVPRRVDKLGQPLLQDLHDKALLALLSLQVLRTVEIMRANDDNMQRRDEHWALRVPGKGHDRLIYLPRTSPRLCTTTSSAAAAPRASMRSDFL